MPLKAEVSYPAITQQEPTRWRETVTVDGPTVAKRSATVSASASVLHLDCSRAYVGKLEACGVTSGEVTASRSTITALPTSDTCGGNRRDRKRMPITSRRIRKKR
jgi:hypothetical protein